MTGKEAFSKYGKILSITTRITSYLPRKFRSWLFEAHRNTNGKRGLAIRYILFSSLAKSCGINVSILPGCFFKYPEKISVGDNVSFQPMCFIGAAGGVQIGSNVSMAHGTTILSTSHTFEELDTPIKYQQITMKETIIADDVWIGCGAVILAGVNVGEGCVIGANSTVTKNVKDYSVVVGSPARVISNRRK